MNRLGMLHNRHKGGRCILVANGPSLNTMDLSFLYHECVIGMNKIYLGFKKFRFYPKYYVAVNAKVIEQSAFEIKQLNCVKFISDRCGQGIIKEDALTYRINTTQPPARFCSDITKGLHEGWTVTYAALQIAYFLGFHEVVIIGLDHRYRYDGNPNEGKKMEGPDPNHFCDSYFGYGQDWDNPDLRNSEESFQLARTEYERDGRCIVDATVNGACTVFKKADYRHLFGLPVR